MAREVPGQFRLDTGYGAALTYDSGPISATLGYNQYNPTLTTAGDTGSFKKAAVAASYSFDGRGKLMAGYRWGQSRGADGSTVLRDDFYWAGANYNLTQGVELTLGYYYDDIKKFGDRSIKNPWQVSFIADYRLSKRTDVYLTTAYSKNAGLNFDTSAVSLWRMPTAAPNIELCPVPRKIPSRGTCHPIPTDKGRPCNVSVPSVRGCASGCQGTSEQRACACGQQCPCGPRCACGPQCQCGAGST